MKSKIGMVVSIAAAALAAYASFGATVVDDGIKDPLEELFANPPKEAHAGAWWHWMGGQVTKEGIDGVRSAMDITAQKSLILQGEGGNYSLSLPDSFDAYTRRARPFGSPRRVHFLNTTRKENKQ
jgi:hypothetical protein